LERAAERNDGHHVDIGLICGLSDRYPNRGESLTAIEAADLPHCSATSSLKIIDEL
jgi:hypothetical protein